MADYTPYTCRVVTPDGITFDGDVVKLIVTGKGGQIGLLARHTPLVADLKVGHVKVELPDGTWKTWASNEGFVQVHNSEGSVVVEDAVDVDEIDKELAQKLIDEGNAELEKAKNAVESMDPTVEPDDEAVFRSDVEAAERQVEWGEHLMAMALSS